MPGKFVIGNGEISRLAQYVSTYGSPLMLVAHRDDALRVKDSLDNVRADGVEIIESDFAGEATRAEAERIGGICTEKNCKAVVGLGGGKAIDIAKLVAHENGLPAVIVPTIASNDAPCSKLSVLYHEDHRYSETVTLPVNPDLVVVDSGVIARAPERFLVAGIGDAFATYYEGRACMRSGAKNFNDGLATNAAFALAELCNDVLLQDGVKAVHACRANLVTQALENVIEANILLSGIGFESVGLAVAHALAAGFTLLPETKGAMHGESVALGALVQLVLENMPDDEFKAVLDFYRAVGLPTSLKDIGVVEVTEEKLRKVSSAILKPASCIHNMPFMLDEDMVYSALAYVDVLDELLK
jgi:glycerol dehydrogenase